jgi:hypothetical protein
VRSDGLEKPATMVCAARCTSTLDPANDQIKYRHVTGHGLKDPFSWAPPALAACCCSVGLLRGAGGGGRWGGRGQHRARLASRGASLGALCWDFAGGRLGMPLARPPISWPNRGPAVGRISWLRRVRLESPLGHGDFLSGLQLSGERDGGLGLARSSAVCPLDGHMCANGLLWYAGIPAGAACMGLTT